MKKINKKFRDIKKFPPWAIFLFALMIKYISRCSFKIKFKDPDGYTDSKEKFIITVWHNRLFLLPAIFPVKIRKRTKAVVSASRDGQYLADFIKQFGLKTVRGSSSCKGVNAQRGALKAIQENWHVAFTPDGPRGPKYYMHQGAVHLASITGHRILPVTINASRYWEFKSWDNFQIPKPFSKLTIVVGEALSVPQGISSKKELEVWRRKAEDKLMEITQD